MRTTNPLDLIMSALTGTLGRRLSTLEAQNAVLALLTESADRVAKLEADSDLLNRLYAAGVDNWSGYDEAMRGEK